MAVDGAMGNAMQQASGCLHRAEGAAVPRLALYPKYISMAQTLNSLFRNQLLKMFLFIVSTLSSGA